MTSYCLGYNVANVPIIAPTAAPPELGEELALRICFKGAVGAARIEVKLCDSYEVEVDCRTQPKKRHLRLGFVNVWFVKPAGWAHNVRERDPFMAASRVLGATACLSSRRQPPDPDVFPDARSLVPRIPSAGYVLMCFGAPR